MNKLEIEWQETTMTKRH